MNIVFKGFILFACVLSMQLRADVVVQQGEPDESVPYQYGFITEYSELRGLVVIDGVQYRLDKFRTELGQVVNGPQDELAEASPSIFSVGDGVYFSVSESSSVGEAKKLEFLYRVME